MRVIDKRHDSKTRSFKRRRECVDCQHRWNTYELTEFQLDDNVGALLMIERVREVVNG